MHILPVNLHKFDRRSESYTTRKQAIILCKRIKEVIDKFLLREKTTKQKQTKSD